MQIGAPIDMFGIASGSGRRPAGDDTAGDRADERASAFAALVAGRSESHAADRAAEAERGVQPDEAAPDRDTPQEESGGEDRFVAAAEAPGTTERREGALPGLRTSPHVADQPQPGPGMTDKAEASGPSRFAPVQTAGPDQADQYRSAPEGAAEWTTATAPGGFDAPTRKGPASIDSTAAAGPGLAAAGPPGALPVEMAARGGPESAGMAPRAVNLSSQAHPAGAAPPLSTGTEQAIDHRALHIPAANVSEPGRSAIAPVGQHRSPPGDGSHGKALPTLQWQTGNAAPPQAAHTAEARLLMQADRSDVHPERPPGGQAHGSSASREADGPDARHSARLAAGLHIETHPIEGRTTERVQAASFQHGSSQNVPLSSRLEQALPAPGREREQETSRPIPHSSGSPGGRLPLPSTTPAAIPVSPGSIGQALPQGSDGPVRTASQAAPRPEAGRAQPVPGHGQYARGDVAIVRGDTVHQPADRIRHATAFEHGRALGRTSWHSPEFPARAAGEKARVTGRVDSPSASATRGPAAIAGHALPAAPTREIAGRPTGAPLSGEPATVPSPDLRGFPNSRGATGEIKNAGSQQPRSAFERPPSHAATASAMGPLPSASAKVTEPNPARPSAALHPGETSAEDMPLRKPSPLTDGTAEAVRSGPQPAEKAPGAPREAMIGSERPPPFGGASAAAPLDASPASVAERATDKGLWRTAEAAAPPANVPAAAQAGISGIPQSPARLAELDAPTSRFRTRRDDAASGVHASPPSGGQSLPTPTASHAVAASPAGPGQPFTMPGVAPAEGNGDRFGLNVERGGGDAGSGLTGPASLADGTQRGEAGRSAAVTTAAQTDGASATRQIADAVRLVPGRGTVDVALHPEELGRVRVSFTPAEAGLTVTIQAERPETLEILRRHIDLLGSDLRDQGFGEIAFEFRGGEGRDDRRPGGTFKGDSSTDRPAGPDLSLGPATPVASPDPPSREGSLDLRL